MLYFGPHDPPRIDSIHSATRALTLRPSFLARARSTVRAAGDSRTVTGARRPSLDFTMRVYHTSIGSNSQSCRLDQAQGAMRRSQLPTTNSELLPHSPYVAFEPVLAHIAQQGQHFGHRSCVRVKRIDRIEDPAFGGRKFDHAQPQCVALAVLDGILHRRQAN